MINWRKGIIRIAIVLQSIITMVVILYFANYDWLPNYTFRDDVEIILKTNLQTVEILEIKQEYELFLNKREPNPFYPYEIDFSNYLHGQTKYVKLVSEIIQKNDELLKIKREKQNTVNTERLQLVFRYAIVLLLVWVIPYILLWAIVWIIKGFA